MTTTDLNRNDAMKPIQTPQPLTDSDRIAVEKAVTGIPVEQAMPLPGGLREDVINSQVQELKALFKDSNSFQKYAELLTSGLRGETSVLTSFNSDYTTSHTPTGKSGIEKFNIFHEYIRDEITAQLNEADSERVEQFLNNLADGVRTALQDPHSKLSATRIIVNPISPEEYATTARNDTMDWVKEVCASINASEELEAKINDHFKFAIDRIFISHDGFSKPILAKKIAQACKEHGLEMPARFRDIIDSLASELPANSTVAKSEAQATPQVAVMSAAKPAIPTVIESAMQINPNRDQDFAALRRAEQSVCDRLNAEYKKAGRSGMPTIAKDFIHATFETIAERPHRFNAKAFEREMLDGLRSNAIPTTPKIEQLISEVIKIASARNEALEERAIKAREQQEAVRKARENYQKPRDYDKTLLELSRYIDSGIMQQVLLDLIYDEKLYLGYCSALTEFSEAIKEPGGVTPQQILEFIDTLSAVGTPENQADKLQGFLKGLADRLKQAGVKPDMFS